jgi:dienelactone hydrolase
LLQQPDLPPDGKIGMMGISFAGGLSIVAAGRPSIHDRVAFVLSFGGHGDLPRTLHYLATGIQPDGSHRPPHDYGVAIILLGVADRVVPASQAPALRMAILSFLEASRLDMVDKEQASREFTHARLLADGLPEPSRTLMAYVNNRDVNHLGPILAPHLTALGGDPALSPDHSPPPACPVYLLHGMDDNVIPSIESALLARTLRDRGVTVRFLATPIVTHASVDYSALASSAWALVRFWSAVLDD